MTTFRKVIIQPAKVFTRSVEILKNLHLQYMVNENDRYGSAPAQPT